MANKFIKMLKENKFGFFIGAGAAVTIIPLVATVSQFISGSFFYEILLFPHSIPTLLGLPGGLVTGLSSDKIGLFWAIIAAIVYGTLGAFIQSKVKK